MADLKLNPALIAGAAFALLISLAALFVYLRGNGDSPDVSANGQIVAASEPEDVRCSGGEDFQPAASVHDGKFEVLGEFVSVSSKYVNIQVPERSVTVILGTDADVAGQFLPGDWIAASGRAEDGRLLATEFRQPCSDTVIGPAPITPEPSPSTSPARTRSAAPPPTPAPPPPTEAPPPPTAAPTPSPEPVPPGATWPTPTATLVDEGDDGGG